MALGGCITPFDNSDNTNMKRAIILPKARFETAEAINDAKLEAKRKNCSTKRRTRPWRSGSWFPPYTEK